MAPLPSPKIFKWLNQTKHTLREFPKRFAKDRMRLHELSRLLERDRQYVFLDTHKKIKIAKRGKNVMSIAQFFMIQNLLHC